MVLDHVGVYIFAGAAGTDVASWDHGLRKAGYLKETVTAEHYHTMGKWMPRS
jgi:hypothetical protein